MMKMRNFVASIAACAVAASAMAVSASAAVLNPNTDDFYCIDAITDYDVTAIYGVKVDLTWEDGGEGCGGGFGFNSESTGWASNEFGNEGSGKTAEMDANGDFTYMSDAPIFASTDTYAQVWIQSWWGADFTVDEVEYLDLDGKVIGEEAPTTTTNAAPEGGDTTTTTKAGSNATGDAGVALAVAGLAVAGAAAYVARKKD